MKIGPRGLNLIKEFEKCYLYSFDDADPECKPIPVMGNWKGTLTIGWGRTRGVTPGQTCSQQQADQWLVEDVAEAESDVNALVRHIPLSQSMFDALVSWTYNLGGTNLSESTMLVRVRSRNFLEVPSEMIRWYKTKGFERGLLRRRCLEAALFVEDPFP